MTAMEVERSEPTRGKSTPDKEIRQGPSVACSSHSRGFHNGIFKPAILSSHCGSGVSGARPWIQNQSATGLSGAQTESDSLSSRPASARNYFVLRHAEMYR